MSVITVVDRDYARGWIQEIRSFYINRPLHPVSAHAQALWNYLMFRLNETWWRQPLMLSTKELAGALDLSETAIKEARSELIGSGHLRHEPQGGNRAPKYFLLSSLCYGDIVRREGTDGRDAHLN